MSTIIGVLTNSGTVISEKTFESCKQKLIVTKYISFRGLTFKYPQYKKTTINDRVVYQVPRGALSSYSSTVHRDAPDTIDNVGLQVTLHDYQLPIVNDIHTVLKEKYCYFLQMDAGLGKTFVAAGVINKFKVVTCIIVANKLLRQQMYDDLVTAFGDTVTISKDKKVLSDINLVVINTAVKMPADIWKKFGLVIMDEVHSYCSEKFMEIFFRADHSMYVMGMTATPERLDSMESVAKIHLGPVRKAIDLYNGIESCRPSKFYGRVVALNYYGPDSHTQTVLNKNGVMSPILMAKQFLQDDIRMTVAANVIADLYDSGRNIYVFCQTKDPLKTLRRRILRLTGRDKEYCRKIKKDIYIVTGDSTYDESNEARSEARIFLTTYSLSSKGLSLPRFDTLMFLTSMKSNMTQIVGRIFRKGSDESIERLIIDIVDARTKIKRQWYGRAKEYKARGLDIKKVELDWNKLSGPMLENIIVNEINSHQIRDQKKITSLGIAAPIPVYNVPRIECEIKGITELVISFAETNGLIKRIEEEEEEEEDILESAYEEE